MEAGFHFTMSSAVYLADPCPVPSLTQSVAKILVDQSPAHAKEAHPRLWTPRAEDDEGEKYEKNKAIGNAAHALILGRGKLLAVGEFDSWRSARAKEFRDEARDAGQEPLLYQHYETALAIAKAAHAQLGEIEGCETAFRGNGAGEVVAIVREDDVWLRTMIDWLPADKRIVWDLKTSGTPVSPHAVGRKAAGDGWHIQAAMHERLLNALDPEGAGRRRFRFVGIEQDAPHALSVVDLPEHWLAMGRRQLAVAINLWRQCMLADEWPGYGRAIITPEFPNYVESAWLDRETTMVEAGLWSLDGRVLGAPNVQPMKLAEPV